MCIYVDRCCSYCMHTDICMPSSLCVAGMGVTCVSLQCYRCKQNCSYFFSEPGLIHVGAINYCSKTIILLVLPITGGHFNPNCKPIQTNVKKVMATNISICDFCCLMLDF